MLLPILPVKIFHSDFLGWRFKATDINRYTIWVGTRSIKRFDTTDSTKGMVSHFGIKSIGGEVTLALKQGEIFQWHNQM